MQSPAFVPDVLSLEHTSGWRSSRRRPRELPFCLKYICRRAPHQAETLPVVVDATTPLEVVVRVKPPAGAGHRGKEPRQADRAAPVWLIPVTVSPPGRHRLVQDRTAPAYKESDAR